MDNFKAAEKLIINKKVVIYMQAEHFVFRFFILCYGELRLCDIGGVKPRTII